MPVLKQFIFGVEDYPEWFTKRVAEGKVKIQTDEETGEVVKATIYRAASVLEAKVGDIIKLAKTGLVVFDTSQGYKQTGKKSNAKKK